LVESCEKNQKRTQSRKGAKNPQSFSLRNLCVVASLRECFFAAIQILRRNFFLGAPP
jgi:hypothetical protein